ncbi:MULTISPECIES: ATP-grasp domain-containing protein [Pseudomonas]|jgi:biotin carboxylase|uniref:ATP-grasp domain-containing protein n=1 Tax=Pseudomonas syringae pv. syringae TaxID=321 RepID=A0AAE5VSM9_PSESY|nr:MULTISPECIES: ATP-grasp domain-containing protein [Pseudomonas]MBP1084310.1 biotin carboxylase [Pseudomonas sp. PvP007]MBP1139166.1 biotin carboxylase [Pseudomonas sp. PvP009]MBP1194651.1 biotin carboxylase [Pseudomonas sp. PvP100]MBS7426402.1 ATP-grasp domain-containing protein [Pseudomonas syringae]MBS7435721.1 ATP-grasp domain-containing protein [Pseudomonas syringae]
MSIVVIDPVSSGINYINAAQQLGVGVYVFSCDGGEQELNAELRAKVRQVIKIDTGDFEAQLKKINELGDVRAVLPGVEYAVPMAARLGAASGTTHLHDSAVEKVRNKFNFRSRLTEAGLSTIGFFLLDAHAPVAVPEGFSFPAVVKPIDMAGSIGVRKLYNHQELIEAVETFRQSLPDDIGFTASGQLIVEAYIPGTEYSVEGIVRSDGSVTLASITEKLLGSEPYFVEVGHIVGQGYEEGFRRVLTDYSLAVLEAIKLNVGPFHLELRVTPQGQPVAVELAARLPGDNIVELIRRASGIDLAKETLCEYLDIDSRAVPRANGVSAIAFIPRGDKSEFTELQGLSDIFDSPYYLSHQVYYRSGDALGSDQDWTSRIGYVMFGGTDEALVRSLVGRVHTEVGIV